MSRNIEQWLNDRACLYCGEDYVSENAVFGAAETRAVKAAQARAGLEQTGTVDRETWAALRAQSRDACDIGNEEG